MAPTLIVIRRDGRLIRIPSSPAVDAVFKNRPSAVRDTRTWEWVLPAAGIADTRAWLETHGHTVIDTGDTRDPRTCPHGVTNGAHLEPHPDPPHELISTGGCNRCEPDHAYRVEHQAEINARGIAKVRAALARWDTDNPTADRTYRDHVAGWLDPTP